MSEFEILQQKHNKSLMSLKLVILFCSLFIVLAIHPLIITLVLLFLCIWSLLSIEKAIQAMFLTAIIKLLNPAVYSFLAETGVLVWLVTILACARLAIAAWLPQIRQIFPFLFFFLLVAILSIFFSAVPTISMMKITSFTFVVTSILAGFNELSDFKLDKLKKWYFSLFAAVVCLSLPTFLFSGIGFYVNGSGFQGILKHPQVLGVFIVPVAVWATLGILFRIKIISFLNLTILLFLWILMFMSEARTSIIAGILSLFFSVIVIFLYRKDISLKLFSHRFAVLIPFGCLLIAITIVFLPEISNKTHHFVFKGESVKVDRTDIGGAFYSSRGKGIEEHLKNFVQKPLTGHGFGVYPSGLFPSGVTEFWGIPISASVEKGFLPTAILEEIGLLGSLFFCFLIYILAKEAFDNPDIRWGGVFLSCIFINIGECVVFSIGGPGLYFWLLIGLSTSVGKNSVVGHEVT